MSEGAALGVAILAAVGVGDYASVPEATKRIIKVKEKATPKKKAVETYDRQYAKYAGLYPALQGSFAELCG